MPVRPRALCQSGLHSGYQQHWEILGCDAAGRSILLDRFPTGGRSSVHSERLLFLSELSCVALPLADIAVRNFVSIFLLFHVKGNEHVFKSFLFAGSPAGIHGRVRFHWLLGSRQIRCRV